MPTSATLSLAEREKSAPAAAVVNAGRTMMLRMAAVGEPPCSGIA